MRETATIKTLFPDYNVSDMGEREKSAEPNLSYVHKERRRKNGLYADCEQWGDCNWRVG